MFGVNSMDQRYVQQDRALTPEMNLGQVWPSLDFSSESLRTSKYELKLSYGASLSQREGLSENHARISPFDLSYGGDQVVPAGRFSSYVASSRSGMSYSAGKYEPDSAKPAAGSVVNRGGRGLDYGISSTATGDYKPRKADDEQVKLW